MPAVHIINLAIAIVIAVTFLILVFAEITPKVIGARYPERTALAAPTAIGVFITAHKHYTERGAKLKLCNVDRRIQNVFVITRLSLVFEVYESEAEAFAFLNRWEGHYRAIFFVQIFCNVLVPQIFWFRWARRSEVVLLVGSILINVGMWAERFMIIAVSLTRDFIPSSWANYAPTWVDWGLLFGSICTFATLFLLFLRFLPAIPLFEVKELRRELDHAAHAASHGAAHAGEVRS